LGEAILMAEDAIKGYLSVLQEDGDPLPREGKSVSVGLEISVGRVEVIKPDYIDIMLDFVPQSNLQNN